MQTPVSLHFIGRSCGHGLEAENMSNKKIHYIRIGETSKHWRSKRIMKQWKFFMHTYKCIYIYIYICACVRHLTFQMLTLVNDKWKLRNAKHPFRSRPTNGSLMDSNRNTGIYGEILRIAQVSESLWGGLDIQRPVHEWVDFRAFSRSEGFFFCGIGSIQPQGRAHVSSAFALNYKQMRTQQCRFIWFAVWVLTYSAI